MTNRWKPKPQHLAWVLSVTSGLMLWMMGDKHIAGPVIGLCNQILWIVYAVWLKQYGLLPGIVAYTAIHARNLWQWMP